MPQRIAYSEQLSLMTRAVDEYCAANGITDACEREKVGERVYAAFEHGASSIETLLRHMRPGGR